MKILIVEDEEILLKVLQEKLEGEKYKTALVTDGAEVVRRAKTFRPDLILLDLILPNKDGFEVLKELKSDPNLKLIPVVVLSNLGQDEEIKRALQLGAVDYLVKIQHPINEVVEKLKHHLLAGK